LIQAYKTGNSESTIAFLKYLLSQCRESQIALLWMEPVVPMRLAYLESVNQGLEPTKWKITCIPNAPEQNPIENIWLQGKRLVRECYHLCQNFSTVKFLFEFVTHLQTFDFPSFILMAVSHNSFRLL